MAVRGRKPQAPHLKLVRGNPRKESVGKLEAKAERAARMAPPAMPAPPPELEGTALREWQRLAPLLHKGGLLAEVDASALAAVCGSFGLWMDAERRFAKIRHMDPVFGGLVVKSSKGSMIPNPLLQVATKARNDYVRLCTEFGLTPASRARIAGIEPPEDADPAERFWD